MLKHLYLDNFKALNDFSIEFNNKLTVLIGENSTGKSSILHAIDLMRAFVATDLDTYFAERGWKYSEIKSQIRTSSKNRITFIAKFCISVNNENISLVWKFILNIIAEDIAIEEESLVNAETNKPIFTSSQKELRVYNPNDEINKNGSMAMFGISLKSSFLKIIDDNTYAATNPILVAFKRYIMQIDDYEMLSPERMRSGNRGITKNIGSGGERLFSYIKGLSTEKRKMLEDKIRAFINNVAGIDAVVKGRPGWIDLIIKEKYDNIETHIKSKYISDGIMRIIALCSLALLDNSEGILLLDEIEDGINPYLAAKAVSMLKDVISQTKRQIIVTTHSPVILNFFDHEEIILMWRDKKGSVHTRALFGSDEMKNTLNYMNPGEVWLNFSLNNILSKLHEEQNSKTENV